MNKLLIYIIALGISMSSFGQGNITLKTPQPAGTQIACQSISLQPGFSFVASGGSSLTLKADPYACDPYGGTTGSFSSNQNYILTRTYTKEDGSRYLDQVQYFDGLGRPVQTVHRGITSDAQDLVSIQEYDGFGRESNSWLPGKVTSANNGAFIPIETAKNYIKISNDNDQKPYSFPVYENSPLNRILEQYGPGEEWQKVANKKAVRTKYLSVSSSDTLNGYYYTAYKSGDLLYQIYRGSEFSDYASSDFPIYITWSSDEDGNVVIQFKDNRDKILLSRQIDRNGSKDIFYDTNYIYNEFGDLIIVLPPMASDAMKSVNYLESTSSPIANYAYQYVYDDRRRCIAKKLPGCDWIYYVYDKADRVIFTQDGEQRASTPKLWTYNKYDAFGRVVITGIHRTSDTHEALQDRCRDIVVRETASNTADAYCGYTWNSLAGVVGYSAGYVLQINYYDDYEALLNQSTAFGNSLKYTDKSGYGTWYIDQGMGMKTPKGLLVGTRTRHMGELGVFIGETATSMYYDNRGRVIQTKSTNHLGGVEEEYITYNFTGQPEKKLHIHTKDSQGGGKQEELYTYTYDHAGRLLSTRHKWNTGAEVTLAENSYDELGRLKTNKKGGQSNLNTAYSYNVRSWTKKIESPLFNQELFYNESYGGSTKQYNGNISAMSWKQSNESATLGYAFTYDNLSRLTQAAYLGNGSVYTNGYETEYSYDKHGNIKTLRRNGRTFASTYGPVDNLTMTYNGNQLQKVSDAVPNFAFAESADFKNYGGSNAAYTYNRNGAMESDLHKGINRIQYNSLNLPYELLIKNTEVSGKVYYTYSASGVKLNTRHMKAQNLGYTPVTGTADDTNLDIVKTTDYVGNLVYEDNTLKRILVDGGYIENNVYYFYVTDHLGNNRVVANQGGASVQRTHYYPFGMAFATGTTQEQGKQPYKYNGKELDQMHGLNLYDYSARYYEPAIGRFTTVDPHAENYYSWSPYHYAANNPIRITDPTGMDWWSTNNPDEIERVLAALKAGEKVNTKSFGEDWARVTDKEVLDAKAKGVFDDVSLDLTIDGQSWKDFNGYGVKNNLDLGIGLMSLGSATIWSKYASDMELSQLGKFRLGNKIYSQLYLGGKIHSSALIKGSKASFLSGVKLGGYAKLGSTVLSGISVFSTSIDLIQAYKKEDPAAMFESNFDAFMTGVGFVGPVGAGVSAYWSVTKPLRKKWAEQVLLPYLKTTNGIVYPAFFPFK